MQVYEIQQKSDKVLDFRVFLQQELIRRCKTNPKYSLRAFARFLRIDSSRLSKILKGTRPIQTPMIDHLSLQLRLQQSEIQRYKNAYAQKVSESSTSVTTKRRQYLQLSLDSFEIIVDWSHYAILELMKVRGFQPSPRWIARRLGIMEREVDLCLERLQRVGLLEIDSSGKWKDKSDGSSTHILDENLTSCAHKKMQEEILSLAIRATREVPIEQRDQSSMMMATHTNRVRVAKRRISKFRRDICDYLEKPKEKNSVYQLSISLFPLENIGRSKV